VNLDTEAVKLLDKVYVAKGTTRRVQVAVFTPLFDPVGHAFGKVRRVGLDDDVVDTITVRKSAVPQDIPEVAESADGGGKLGALTGCADAVTELERSVVVIVGAPVDTASCDSVCAAIVSARTVSGDVDCTSESVGIPPAIVAVIHLSCRCEELGLMGELYCSFEAVGQDWCVCADWKPSQFCEESVW